MLRVNVEVYASVEAFEAGAAPLREYEMNHDCETERKTLGMQCRNAFEAGQMIVTYSKGKKREPQRR
jgi:hypothetical protein